MSMPIILPTSLLRIKLYHRINAHYRNTRLDRTLQLFILAHRRFQHTCLDLIHYPPFAQVEPVIAIILTLGGALLTLAATTTATAVDVFGVLVAAVVIGDDILYGTLGGAGYFGGTAGVGGAVRFGFG